MAYTVERRKEGGTPSYEGSYSERKIVEQYVIEGDQDSADDASDPSIAQGLAGVPQYRDAHPVIAACRVVNRRFVQHGPYTSIGTITYSDKPALFLQRDGASTLTVDMMGHTTRTYWDINTGNVIGANFEGAEVYVPRLTLVYRHLESLIDVNIYPLTGTINDAIWKGFAIRTVLFLGARAEESGSDYLLTYNFLYDPFAHRVYWQPYEEEVVAGGVDRIPLGPVQTSDVYPEGDFSLLPI